MLTNLTQQSHPRLWLLFQSVFGCHRDKRMLAMRYLPGHKNILEVGCSMGTVSAAFSRLKGIHYLGVDIDSQAIEFAKSRFSKFKHMEFSNISLEDLVKTGRKFDYVLFANILHHVNDEDAIRLLQEAVKAVEKSGQMIIMEPDILGEREPLLVRMTYRLERGQYRRSLDQLLKIVREAGITVKTATRENLSIDPLPGIVWGRFLLLTVSGSQAA